MVYLLVGFVIMFLFTYIGGVYDDAFKKTYYTGVWLELQPKLGDIFMLRHFLLLRAALPFA